MADVYSYLVSQGLITVDAGVILTQVQTEYQALFGADIILTSNTPQGVLMSSEVQARTAVADNNAAVANQINPNQAGGIFLDAIMQLTGIQRIPALPTTLPAVNLTGVPGTIIPGGSLAMETVTNQLFQTVSPVTLSLAGTAAVGFISLVDAPITVAIGGLNTIVSNILGWETVSNPSVSIPGQLTMSDNAARVYRNATLFAQGSAMIGAIVAAVMQVPGVTSVYPLENITSTTMTINGVSMVGHSIYLCIAGTYNNEAVANAIQSRKSGGCNYNNGPGNAQSQAITLPFSGQVINVLWDAPNIIPVYVIVTAKLGAATVTDPTAAIKQAIQDYQNGLIEGQPGLVVGASVSSFELAAAINSEVTGLFVSNVQVGNAPAPTGITVAISAWQQANIPVGNITVMLS